MKKFTRHISTLIWALAGLYLALAVLLDIPAVQRQIGTQVAAALAQKLGTRVWVGRVDLGLLHRIIIDDVRLQDQRGKEMLRASRISAKLDYVALTRGEVVISSAQLFGLRANLYRRSAESKPNYQFVLDALASKDTTQSAPLHLDLRSLIIRHGELSYNQLDAPRKKSLDTRHLRLSNISAHVMLNYVQDDSLNLYVKHFQLQEQCGLDLRKLSLRLRANRHEALLSDFTLQLPQSELLLGDITASYEMRGKKLDTSTLKYNGSIPLSYISSNDIAPLLPAVGKLAHTMLLRSNFSGTASSLSMHRLEAAMPEMPSSRNIADKAIMRADISGTAHQLTATPVWSAQIATLMVSSEGLNLLAGELPAEVSRMGHFSYSGHADGYGRNISTRGLLESGIGNASLNLALNGDDFAGQVKTAGFNLALLLDDARFGPLATDINLSGNLQEKRYKARGFVSRMTYNGYDYHNIQVDGSYNRGAIDGLLSIDDAEVSATVKGQLSTGTTTAANLTAQIHRFNPAAINLNKGRLGNAVYAADIDASFTGDNINTAMGSLTVRNLTRSTADSTYVLDSLLLRADTYMGTHRLQLRADFAQLDMAGRFDYATIAQSVKNAIAIRLPSIQQLTPIKYIYTPDNDFSLSGTISRSDWLETFFGVDLQLSRPLTINATMDSNAHALDAAINAPALSYDGHAYRDVRLMVSSPGDTLRTQADLVRMGENGVGTELHLSGSAVGDRLVTALAMDNHAAKQRLRGHLNAVVQFARNSEGAAEAHMCIDSSYVSIGDSVFSIHPSTVVYSRNRLEVDRLQAKCGAQRVTINGITTRDTTDSLTVDLANVNVAYILDLVNFHSVEFSGYATGRATVSQLFGQPDASAQLQVDDFRFQDGRMGTLHAQVAWNGDEEQIDINAQAADTMLVGGVLPNPRSTDHNRYLSPKPNYKDLAIYAHDTRCEFLESFCSSFMRRADITGNGSVNLWGDLSRINLTGSLVVDGTIELSALNTQYTLRGDTLVAGIDEIAFPADTIRDRDGHIGIITGRLTHTNLTRLGFDLNIDIDNMLGYDWGPTYGSTFWGTVWGTGRIGIKGKPGEVNIDVNATADKGSIISYDASSPDAIGDQEFIHWSSRDSLPPPPLTLTGTDSLPTAIRIAPDLADIPTDIYINFLVNTTPESTLHLLMDKASGDYINLNGESALRISYYNKGSLDIFGTYLVDHGIYKMTIQNVIKRDFQFTSGGTIVFGGRPYDAQLNLSAQYTLPSVSLSDLQIGRSFTSNNIRVNCLMNITGTPETPKVDFALDMPTVGDDAKQMIMSLINSEEEMNQQVIYLLAVGRFYAQGSNNMGTGSSDSQTQLTMQSILSGQISQQLNNVLGSVVKNTNWNFGANISTGDEGWNNAEYEGLLSGRMLNNRLLFDGQFGYRDINQATTSIIGDFDLRYRITPNGNISVHVYNQTNDRYFTRNSLTTQGLGFILKRDFDSWRSLFKRKKKSTETKDKSATPTDSVAR